MASTIHAASISDFTDEITLEQAPYRFSFLVTNYSGFSQPLTISNVIPAQVEYTYVPSSLKGGETDRVVLTIYPNESLNGSRYVTTLTVKVGEETIEKTLAVRFRKKSACPVRIYANSIRTHLQENSYPFIDVRFRNDALESQEIKFITVRGAPADWKFDFPEKVTVAPRSEGMTSVKVIPQSTFNGELEFQFECDGFLVIKKTSVSFEGKNGTNPGFPFSGFVPLTGVAGTDSVLNGVLFLMVAILLVTFISRLVQMLHVSQTQSMPAARNAPEPRHTGMNELKEKISKGAKK
ncbi:MAG: hypothetical protein HY917_04950 [Candidatus Diapherotrites archaeon]|nr:hypothetical protein [Candidatus Diapherotrites archaeon]